MKKKFMYAYMIAQAALMSFFMGLDIYILISTGSLHEGITGLLMGMLIGFTPAVLSDFQEVDKEKEGEK